MQPSGVPLGRRIWLAYRLRVIYFVLIGAALFWLSNLPVVEHAGRVLTWKSLLPPAVALGAVVVTRRVILSLLMALISASLVARPRLSGLARGLDEYIWQNVSDPWHLSICGFAVSVLVTVRIAEDSGGTRAVVESLEGCLRSARAVKLGTFTLGLLVFFDDYANSMIVGPSMRPLADRYRVSREKLAYIVDSTAAPVAGLALVSTWLGYEVGLLQESTRALDLEFGGYALLLQALPFRFYCVFALFMVLANSALERDFGPMLKAEKRAQQAPKTAPAAVSTRAAESSTFFVRNPWLNSAVPMSALLLFVMIGLFYDGGGFSRFEGLSSLIELRFWRDTLSSSQNSEKVLLIGGLVALGLSCLFSQLSRRLTPKGLANAINSGLRMALFPVSILVLAWGLGSACKDVGTGPYLVEQLGGLVPVSFVPLITFSGAALVALATGTSWGTMAIVIPAAIPLAHSLGGLGVLLPTIAAVLDGAIFGDHCSPISDTTVLSSTATQCDVVQHVWTQLPYASVAMSAAASAYLLTGFGASLWAVYTAGGLGLLLTVRFVGRKATYVRDSLNRDCQKA